MVWIDHPESCNPVPMNEYICRNGLMIICVHVCLAVQSCPALYDPMDCSQAPLSMGFFSLHRILQMRIQEWVAIPFFRGSSWPRDGTQVSFTAGGLFSIWATRDHMGCDRLSVPPLLCSSREMENWCGGSNGSRSTQHLGGRNSIWGALFSLENHNLWPIYEGLPTMCHTVR